jgi:hypothetical protein
MWVVYYGLLFIANLWTKNYGIYGVVPLENLVLSAVADISFTNICI